MDISNYTAHGAERLHNSPYATPASAAAGGAVDATGATPPRPNDGATEAPAKTANTQSTSQTAAGGQIFETVLDTVNPLQHVPGVSSAYQAATGDESSPLADMAGGFLFGGPVGLMAGAAKSFLEMVTGKSMMDHAVAFFGGEDGAEGQSGATQTAHVPSDGPLLGQQADPALTLQNYQAFAQAAGDGKKGTGAQSTEVSWADTIWTDRALKDATGLYENTQKLGKDRTENATREQRNVMS